MPLTSVEQALALLAQRGALPPPTADTPRMGPWPTKLQADLRRQPGIEDLPTWLQPIARLFGAPEKLDTAQAQYPAPPPSPSLAAETRRVQERRLGIAPQPNPAAGVLSLLNPAHPDPDVMTGVIDPFSLTKGGLTPAALAEGTAGAAERATVGTALPSAIKTVTPDSLAAAQRFLQTRSGEAPLVAIAAEEAPKKLSAAALAKLLKTTRGAWTPEVRASVLAEIKAQFPTHDKYAKEIAGIPGQNLLKRAGDLSPEAQSILSTIQASIDPKRKIRPGELHAMVSGEKYVPTRLVRPPLPSNYNYKTNIPGAPLGVQTPADEDAALEQYLQHMANGVRGADFYSKGGESMLFHVGGDEDKARLLAALHSLTSSRTGFDVNQQFAAEGWNQQALGRPIHTGRFPNEMSPDIQQVVDQGTANLMANPKRGPFYDALARGGKFQDVSMPTRPTNDIWQGEAFGFANADGTPYRQAFTKLNHAWMDAMSNRAVDLANARAVGGRTDWDLDKAQAAAWFGVRQGAGEKLEGDFDSLMRANYGQEGRETTPGGSTGHLAGLSASANAAWRQYLDDLIYGWSHNLAGQDRFSLAANALTGRSIRGPGAYQGMQAPGLQTQMVTKGADTPVPGISGTSKVLAPASRDLGNAIAAWYALNQAQAMSAFGRFFPGQPVNARNAFDVPLGRVPTHNEFAQVIAELAKRGLTGDDAAQIFGPEGYVVKDINQPAFPTQTPELTPEQFAEQFKAVKEARAGRDALTREAIEAVHGPDITPVPGTHDAATIFNDWSVEGQQYGQRYYEAIRPIREAFDTHAPEFARQANASDKALEEASGGQFKQDDKIVYLRNRIINHGPDGAFAELEAIAKEFGISVIVLASMLGLGHFFGEAGRDQQS